MTCTSVIARPVGLDVRRGRGECWPATCEEPVRVEQLPAQLVVVGARRPSVIEKVRSSPRNTPYLR